MAWRTILEYHGRYQVSNRTGRVRELWHWTPGPRSKRVGQIRIIRQQSSKGGYLRVWLSQKLSRREPRIQTPHLVHKLVLETFIGPCPPDHEAAHFPDRDVTNNRLTNLRWATKQENYADRHTHGTDNTGERNGRSKLTLIQVRRIRRLYQRGNTSHRKLAKRFNVARSVIGAILNNESWRE
jgi:hypothetical protein